MKYVQIPGSNLKPSCICLGSTSMGTGISREGSFELMDAFLAAGGTFLDTARCYADWVPGERQASEKTIGRWIKERGARGRVVLATKGAHPEIGGPGTMRLSCSEIEFDLNESLKNLQTDLIDLYWLHRDDPARPVEEIMDALAAQVKAGKIRYFGCSNWHAARIREAQAYAARCGWTGFVGNQMMWSLAIANPAAMPDKTMMAMDDAMYEFHCATGLAAIPYSSQAGGLFSKVAPNACFPGAYDLPANVARARNVRQLSAETGLTVTQIVLGYMLSQPFTTIPIIGCRTVEQLRDSLTAADVHLTREQVTFLATG